MPSDRALARAAAKLAVSPGTTALALDPALDRAAALHAGQVAGDEANASRAALLGALAKEGLSDTQVRPFTAVGTSMQELSARLRRFCTGPLRHWGPTHLGLAVRSAKEGGQQIMVALFARRLVALAPLPARGRPPGHRVRGRARVGDGLQAFVQRPCWGRGPLEPVCPGDVLRLPVERQGPLFSVFVPFERGRGTYVMELLAERDRGPEVSSVWSFRVGDGPAAAAPPTPTVAPAPTVKALGALIRRDRARADVGPLTRHAGLDRAAQAHADRVCATKLAVHRLPGGATPLERARRAGYRGSVSENVAIAPTVLRVHRNLLASPSHRLNLLDPAAVRVGLGLARASGSVCVVQLFGMAPSPPQER